MGLPENGPKVRPTPRFSLNALMRYLDASPITRETLVHDQKYPKTYRSNYYENVCNALIRYFTSETRDRDRLVQEAQRIARLVPSNPQDAVKNGINVEAINLFLSYCDETRFDGMEVSRGPNERASFEVEGLELSVNPDLILRGTHKGENIIGGVKFYFKKKEPLTKAMATTGAVLINKHFQIIGGETFKIRNEHCKILDVFANKIYQAPDTEIKRMRQIEAACREIVRFWPHA